MQLAFSEGITDYLNPGSGLLPATRPHYYSVNSGKSWLMRHGCSQARAGNGSRCNPIHCHLPEAEARSYRKKPRIGYQGSQALPQNPSRNTRMHVPQVAFFSSGSPKTGFGLWAGSESRLALFENEQVHSDSALARLLSLLRHSCRCRSPWRRPCGCRFRP